ncbi:TonB-dependent receptor [bacterium]|nr:TonB-dependent receptor [bacterium]
MVCLLLGAANTTAQQENDRGSHGNLTENTETPSSKISATLANEFFISIPPLNAAEALNRLAKQTGAQLLYSYEHALTRKARPVVGQYSVMEALALLLQGSGLGSSLSNKGAITISDGEKVTQHNQRERINMNSKTIAKKTLLATVIGVFAAGGMGTASAQDQVVEASEHSRIDEVVVTAQKREQRLIDVPISIEALGEEKIKDLGIKTLNDLSYAIPSLSIRSYDDSSHIFSLRGVSNASGTSPHVGIYLDEIPLNFSIQLQPYLQPTDIQRLEVLRGPQGTLYGQGSTGGTVRYITNNPVFNDIEGEITASAYSTQDGGMSNETTAVLNLPVIDDRLAFRVVAGYRDIGGWIDQPDTGKKDVNNTEATNLRIKGLWQASDDIEISGMVLRYRSDVGARNIANIRLGNGTPFYRQVERNGLPTPGTDFDIDNDIYNLTLNYDFGFATLTSSSSHFNIKNMIESVSGNIGQTVAPNSGFLDTDIFLEVEGVSQEIRLASAGDDNKFDWLVGAYYSDADDVFFSPDVGVFSGGVGNNFGVFSTNENSKTNAIFANVDYHLSERLTLTAGARYFEDERTADYVVGTFLDVIRKESFDHFSPKLSLSYSLGDDASIYASIAEGFRSGGFNFFDSTTYEPETIRTYEIGTKASLFDGRLSATSAVFFSQYSDYQSVDRVLNSDGLSIFATSNPGDAEMLGVEWSAQYSLSDQLSVGFNGHYIDTEFTKVSSAVASNVEGDQLNGTPKYSYSLNAKYDFDWAFGAEGFALLDFSEQGGSVDIARNQIPAVVESESVRLLNAQVGAQWDQLSVRLFGRNLTNERELTIPVRSNNEFFQHRPRTLGAELSYRF